MTISENIKKLRMDLCLNQLEFSRALDVTPASVSCYENGKRQPSYPTIRKILALAKQHNLNISLEDIRKD